MRYGPSAVVGANLVLAVLFTAAAPHIHFALVMCSISVCSLLIATTLSWPRAKPRPKFRLLTFLALLGSALLWIGVLVLVADPEEKLPTAVYYLVQTGIYGGIALLLVAIFAQWAAIAAQRDRGARP
jgi:hypothetical protein